jgi:hypothetical protein
MAVKAAALPGRDDDAGGWCRAEPIGKYGCVLFV